MAMRCLIFGAVCMVAVAVMMPSQSAAQTTEDFDALNEQVVESYQAGKYTEAIPLAQRALSLAESKFGSNSIDAGVALNHLAALYYEDQRFDEIESLLTRAESIRETALERGSMRSTEIGPSEGQCQTNANQTAKCAKRIASGCQLTPLGQRGGAVLLEDVASAEVAIVVEVIVDRGVDGGEFLQGLDVPEFRHCLFPSSERLV